MSEIDEIRALPRWSLRTCECGEKVRTCALQIYSICPACGSKGKQRAFGAIGTEIQDTIDAVLEWAGEGEGLEALLKRHQEINASK